MPPYRRLMAASAAAACTSSWRCVRCASSPSAVGRCRVLHNPVALQLRAMNMLYEGLKDKGALMLVPSSAVESLGMGGMMGAAAMGQARLGARPEPPLPADAPPQRP